MPLKDYLKRSSWWIEKARADDIESRCLMQQVRFDPFSHSDKWIHVQADGLFDHFDPRLIPMLCRKESGRAMATLDGETRAAVCFSRLVGWRQGEVMQQTRPRQAFTVWLQAVDLRQDHRPRPGSKRVPAKPVWRRAMQEFQGLYDGAGVGKDDACQVDAADSRAPLVLARTCMPQPLLCA